MNKSRNPNFSKLTAREYYYRHMLPSNSSQMVNKYAESLRQFDRYWAGDGRTTDAARVACCRLIFPFTIQSFRIPNMTLETAYQDYVRSHSTGLSDATVQIATTALQKFSDYLGHPATIDDLTDDNVRKYQAHRSAGRRASTVNRETKSIVTLWNWLHKTNHIGHAPTVPSLTEVRAAERADNTPWRYDDMARLIAESEAARGMVGPVKASLYWPAFHYVQWEIEEPLAVMLNIRWQDLDLDSGRLLLPTEVRRNNRKPRSILLSPATRRAIFMIQPPARKLIFGEGATLPEVRFLLKQIFIASGMDMQRVELSRKSLWRAFATFQQVAVAMKGGVA